MNCPECDAVLGIPDDADMGEIISCSDCGADYEIAGRDGGSGDVKLKQAETIGEDWGE